VTVRDALGNPIQGATVVLSASPITGNALTQPSGTTNASGVATGTLSSTEAELKTVSATAQVGAGPIVSITQTAGVTVNPAAPSASQSSVGAAPTTITASTGSSTSTITVTVRDAFANPIQGATVVLSANPTTGNALTQPSGTTNASGVATGTLSSTEAELKTVSATAQVGAGPVVAIIQTAGVTVDPAGVSSSQSLVSAAPGTITASNGSSTSTITVTVRDAFANPIQGATVVLSATPITGNALTQPGGTTNASGVATGTLSSTEAELKTVSATAQVGAGPIVSITQTAGVTVNPAAPSAAQSSVSAAPGTITASNGSSTATITVTVRDAFDNLIQGAAVVLSSTGSNNVFVQPGNTNASGVTSGTFRSTTAEGKTISATAQVGAGPIVPITQTAAVTVNPAGADHLVFTVQPSNSQADPNTITPPVVLEVRDAFDNLVSDATDQVTLAITNGTGTPTAQLFGTNPKSAVGGIVTFSNLSIDLLGIGYTLDATAAGMTGATSDPFDITL
jgi:adhesin/invasin